MSNRKDIRTVDIDDMQVYEALKKKAARNRRSLKAYVNLVLEKHCGMVLEGEVEDFGASRVQRPVTSAQELRDRLNQANPRATIKTARELMEEQRAREARRGDESGSQVRDEESDPDF